MKTLLVLAALLGNAKSFAIGCDYKMLVNNNKHEAALNNVTLPLREGVKVCLEVPLVKPSNGLIEWQSVNLGNSSCSSLKMVVRDPKGNELQKSTGSQPGSVGVYQSGSWKMRLKLKSGCNRYNFSARW